MHFSVVVIGAGPAGAAAAMTLAANNVDVCVIDKHPFPRDKLCGGLLTRRSKQVFEHVFQRTWQDVVVEQAHGVSFFDQHKLISTTKDYSTLYFTYRRLFDNYLLDAAIARGALTRLGVSVRNIDIGGNRITLSNGQEITYDYLIGADGVNSMVAKTLFGRAFNKDSIGFALEAELPLSSTIERIAVPEIYFNVIQWGYAWVFQKNDSLTVGLGGMHKYNKDLKDSFRAFLHQRFEQLPDVTIKGHHIPFGDYRKRPFSGNVLLCGDAAGLVDPITGEGIAFAMQSGDVAASAILDGLNSASGDISASYTARLKPITSMLDVSNRLRPMIFTRNINKLFMLALSRSSSLPRRHLDLMADDISYGDYMKYLMARAASKPLSSPAAMIRRLW